MDKEKNCQLCGQSQTCRGLYQKMGELKGPSVVSKVVVVFLLPVVVFTVTLIIADTIAARTAIRDGLSTVICFISALTVTSLFVLFAGKIYKITGKKSNFRAF